MAGNTPGSSNGLAGITVGTTVGPPSYLRRQQQQQAVRLLPVPADEQITAVSVGAHKLKGVPGEQLLVELRFACELGAS
jgi:hypothetical protein